MTSELQFVHHSKAKPWDKNPRNVSDRTICKIAAAMCRVGFASPIAIQKSSGHIAAGHSRHRAFLYCLDLKGIYGLPGSEKGEWDDAPDWFKSMCESFQELLESEHMPACVLDMTDEQFVEFNIADNRLSEEAQWDTTGLHDLFKSMTADARLFTGFDSHELDAFMDDAFSAEIPVSPVEAVVGKPKNTPKKTAEPKAKVDKPKPVKLSEFQRPVFNDAFSHAKTRFANPKMTREEFVFILCQDYLRANGLMPTSIQDIPTNVSIEEF